MGAGVGECCPVPCGMFRHTTGLFPLDAKSNPQWWQPKMSPDIAKCPLGENPPFHVLTSFFYWNVNYKMCASHCPSRAPTVSISSLFPPESAPSGLLLGHKWQGSGSNKLRIYQDRKKHSGQSSPLRYLKASGTYSLRVEGWGWRWGAGRSERQQPGPSKNPILRKWPALLLLRKPGGNRPVLWERRKGASERKVAA